MGALEIILEFMWSEMVITLDGIGNAVLDTLKLLVSTYRTPAFLLYYAVTSSGHFWIWFKYPSPPSSLNESS